MYFYEHAHLHSTLEQRDYFLTIKDNKVQSPFLLYSKDNKYDQFYAPFLMDKNDNLHLHSIRITDFYQLINNQLDESINLIDSKQEVCLSFNNDRIYIYNIEHTLVNNLPQSVEIQGV